MNSFWKCFWSELLKLRRTLTFWMVLLAPLVIQVFNFGMWLTQDMNNYSSDGENIWLHFFGNTQTFWIVLMLPLFIALETALLASVEHSSGQWKHLYALPVPRGMYYTAKWVVGGLVVALASIILLGETYLAGVALDLVTDNYPFMESAMPIRPMAKIVFTAGVCSLLMVSIHTWISQHFHNFTVNIGIGMAAVIANIMLIQSDKPWAMYSPWLVQAKALEIIEAGSLLVAVAIGVGGGLLAALIGGWLVTRRDVV